MRTTKMLAILVLGLMACSTELAKAAPMGTMFTYQGFLMDRRKPANGLYDFQFSLYDDPNAGTQQGYTIDINDLDVIDGHFTVELDFDSGIFTGEARWLETAVRQGASNDPCDFVTLSPRQEMTLTPYAIHAETAKDTNTVDGYHAGAFALGSHNHDNQYYTEAELGSSGSASVHWDNLSNIPEGFADGVDNVGGVDTDWTDDGNNVCRTTGNVGIGTTNPGEKLEVAGVIHSTSGGFKFPDGSTQTTKGNGIAILTGTLEHGGTIPLPLGYTQDQCRWFVSINSLDSYNGAYGQNDQKLFCLASSNRELTCKMEVYNGPTYYGTANYIIIGTK